MAFVLFLSVLQMGHLMAPVPLSRAMELNRLVIMSGRLQGYMLPTLTRAMIGRHLALVALAFVMRALDVVPNLSEVNGRVPALTMATLVPPSLRVHSLFSAPVVGVAPVLGPMLLVPRLPMFPNRLMCLRRCPVLLQRPPSLAVLLLARPLTFPLHRVPIVPPLVVSPLTQFTDYFPHRPPVSERKLSTLPVYRGLKSPPVPLPLGLGPLELLGLLLGPELLGLLLGALATELSSLFRVLQVA